VSVGWRPEVTKGQRGGYCNPFYQYRQSATSPGEFTLLRERTKVIDNEKNLIQHQVKRSKILVAIQGEYLQFSRLYEEKDSARSKCPHVM
jgi:hypothetical protein